MSRYVCFLFATLVLSLSIAGCHQPNSSTQTTGQPATASKAETPRAEGAAATNSAKAVPGAEAAQSTASAPVSTKYYSLDIPKDWSVLFGPANDRGTTRLQLGDNAKTTTVAIIVGPSRPGDAEQIARRSADRLKTTAKKRGNQWEFTARHGKDTMYGIVREDARNSLLMVLTVSGDVAKADFVFQMRTPSYPQLKPEKVAAQ